MCAEKEIASTKIDILIASIDSLTVAMKLHGLHPLIPMVMGEAGEEAIMPLKRAEGSKIKVSGLKVEIDTTEAHTELDRLIEKLERVKALQAEIAPSIDGITKRIDMLEQFAFGIKVEVARPEQGRGY